MQITERPDSRNVPRNDDHIELTALKFKGMIDSLDKFIDRLTKSVERSVEKQSRKLDRRSSTDSRDNRDRRNSREDRRSYRSDSDSSSEDDRHRSRSGDSSRSKPRSRGRSIKTCTYCHKPKDLKKLYSGALKIEGSGDKDEQARWQMLIDIKTFIESEKDSTN